MFFKGLLLSLTALSLGLAASAQVESEGMGDLNAWGERFLGADEAEFPPDLWGNSSDETLLGLMQGTQTRGITPAERALLRRVILSAARPPEGDTAELMLSERASVMLELGEARAAADLAPRLTLPASELNAETIAIDLDMADGREASACRRLGPEGPEGVYGLKLRAVCSVLQGNLSGAELAIEVASQQGLDDPWFVAAVFAAAGDTPNPPPARFDSGLDIALSARAGLDTSDIAPSLDRPGLAAAAAQRPGFDTGLKVRLARIASELDLLTPDEVRLIMIEDAQAQDTLPEDAAQRAIAIMSDPFTFDSDRADALAEALTLASTRSIALYSSEAELLLPDLRALPRTVNTTIHSAVFARASLAAGDVALARDWLGNSGYEGLPQIDGFEMAFLEAATTLAAGAIDRRLVHTIQLRLIDRAVTEEQSDIAARMLAAMAGLGLPVHADARTYLTSQPEAGQPISPFEGLALQAAADDDAIAETALLVLAQTGGSPETLTGPDLYLILTALREIGATDIAERLALEAQPIWVQ